MEEELKDRLCKKLSPGFKKKLITALRSGEFKQCVGSLQSGQNYCVMGVIHKVAYGTDPGNWGNLTKGHDKDNKIPPVFFNENGGASSVQNDLISKNDDGNWSFKKLATFIDKTL